MTLRQERAAFPAPSPVRVIDYEQSDYRTAFWRDADRRYEDAVERLALRRLLPPAGERLVDLGAGFGRLANEYAGYSQVVLFDYSRTMLAQAVERWGHDPRFVFIAGSVYDMPFAPSCMDTAVMVRVMHHLADSPGALREIEGSLRPGGAAVLEFANKRNLKAMLRHAWRGQTWSPYAAEPVEFEEMHFNFHPRWMESQSADAGLRWEETYSVSHLRLPALKRLVPPVRLAQADSWLFAPGGRYPLGPSVFLRARRQGAAPAPSAAAGTEWLRCPVCRTERLTRSAPRTLTCTHCDRAFYQEAGIWDFKEALPRRNDQTED